MSDEPREPDAPAAGAPSESNSEAEAISDAPGRRRTREVDLGPLPCRLGRYEVLAVIGSGGMGTIFRARQVQMDRIVALKVLASELAQDKRYLKRFVREARAAGSLAAVIPTSAWSTLTALR